MLNEMYTFENHQYRKDVPAMVLVVWWIM